MASLLDSQLAALRQAEQEEAMKTGRGQYGTDPVKVATHIGIAKGLQKAQEIVLEMAKKFNTEDELERRT